MKGNVESGRLTIQDEKEFKIILKMIRWKYNIKINLLKIFIRWRKKQIKYDIIKGDKVYIFYEVINNENLSKLTKDLNPNFLLDINNDEYPLYKEILITLLLNMKYLKIFILDLVNIPNYKKILSH